MECMKSFSTFSRMRFNNGLHCAEGEPATLPDLRGKGSRKRVANKVPRPKWKQSWKIPNSCFSAVEFFTAFFAAFFATLFAALFAALFRCTFRHIFRHARPCKLSRQGISIHVTTKRLCQMRWHSIDNTEKHAIMEEGADMPETHCLSRPLCLMTLMEQTCDTQCAPSHQI